MRLNVNPNRMELSKLKKRLATAVRGHKLLKDKQDELMRRFIELVRHNDRLRKEVEKDLMEAYRAFALSGAVISQPFLEEALLIPKERISLEISTKNVMSVNVPVMKFTRESESDDGGEGSLYPYGFYNTSDETDRAIEKLYSILPSLLQLAEVEKSVNLMADEIEKTRRRVNALEYMTIPQLNETISYIKMKLDENERGNLTRLMKVKSMMEEKEA
jgi:V/A-type H+-transporting ATPase subunit D